VKVEGRWDRYLDVTWLVNTQKVTKGTTRRLWEIKESPPSTNGLPAFSASLNDFDDTLKEIVLPTDARRRLDKFFLEKGDSDSATYWKKIMEDRQRIDRKRRKECWTPLWFKKVDDETHETKSMWVYSGEYWEQREKKVALLESGSEEAKALLCPPEVQGLACDFISYTEPSALEGDTAAKLKQNNKRGTGTSTPTKCLEPPADNLVETEKNST